jgi:hypothetical protein
MKGKMLIYRPGDPPERTVTEYTAPIPLADLQAAVGGFIEAVPYWDRFEVDGEVVRAVIWCNEEGKLTGLPRNVYMTDLWEKHLQTQGMSRFRSSGDPRTEADFLVGSIAVVTGDDEFMDEL